MDSLLNTIVLVCNLVMMTTMFWAMFVLPLFYLWFIPTFAVGIWAFVKKKGWKIPLITFAINVVVSWVAMMIFLMNARW